MKAADKRVLPRDLLSFHSYPLADTKLEISDVAIAPEWSRFFSLAKEVLREHGKRYLLQKYNAYLGAMTEEKPIVSYAVKYERMLENARTWPMTAIVQFRPHRKHFVRESYLQLAEMSKARRGLFSLVAFTLPINRQTTAESIRALKPGFQAHTDRWTRELETLKRLDIDVRLA